MRKWESQKLATINLETGEIEEGVNVVVGRRIRWKENYLMTFQDKLEELSEDKDFTGTNFRVMLNLMSKLGWENWLHVNQSEISRKLGIQRADVSRAITLLVKKGVIIKGPKMGHCYAYKLNSNYGFKGKLADLTTYRMKEKRHLELVTEDGQEVDDKQMGLFDQ